MTTCAQETTIMPTTSTIMPSAGTATSESGIGYSPEYLFNLATQQLHELIQAGNIEAIKVALNMRPQEIKVTM